MLAAATAAAAAAADKTAIAAAKQDKVLRMRARDAAEAAQTLRQPPRASTDEVVKAAASALREIAADAGLSRERALLASLKRAAKQIGAAAKLAEGRIEAPPAAAAEPAATAAAASPASPAAAAPPPAASVAPDTSDEYLRAKLAAMADSMEREVQRMRGDRDLAAALQRVAHDGVVDAAELQAALATIARNTPTEAAAAALVKLLDSDRDGKVSVVQLTRLIESFAAAGGDGDAKGPRA